MTTNAATRRLINTDDPHSVSGSLRSKRWRLLVERFPDLGSMRVLDLGGISRAWDLCPIRPERLVMLNFFAQDSPGVQVVVGDACDPPDALRRERFDLVFSNSTIEHVGGHWRRERFAETVHALGDHHWVQTPFRYFPIEPHWLFPGFQFVPLAARVKLAKIWPLGAYPATVERDGEAEAVSEIFTTELLTRTEMRRYFPHSEVLSERVSGLTKSLIAVH